MRWSIAMLAVLAGCSTALAEPGQPALKPKARPAGAAQPTGALPQAKAELRQPVLVALPPAEDLLRLIRTTMTALDQANQTGNYTVLRDLGAPEFRRLNDASGLADVFRVFRKERIDLSPLVLLTPEVTETPKVDRQNRMRLAGFYPTEPLKVEFDFSFEYDEPRWRLYTVGVNLVAPEPEDAPPPKLTVSAKPKP